MNTANNHNNEASDICANCGKGEESSITLKACTACKLVKYCNQECQIAHRPQHKRECKKRAAELHEDALFKEIEIEPEDCPICMIRLPLLESGYAYMSCCGKVICSGCIHAPVFDNQGNEVAEKVCPFCRTTVPATHKEGLKRMNKRVEAGDAEAITNVGFYYEKGMCGLPQDYDKALELWHQAADLGHAAAYYNIGIAYDTGRGVEVDEKKAKHYYELATMEGHVGARHNLGSIEGQAGKNDRALRHYMIAASGGCKESLEAIRFMVTIGDAIKDDYAKALRAYQVYLDEIKSDQRDKAAAANEDFKYY